MHNNIEVFQSNNGAIEFSSDATHETMWASLNQIAKLFSRDKLQQLLLMGKYIKLSITTLTLSYLLGTGENHEK